MPSIMGRSARTPCTISDDQTIGKGTTKASGKRFSSCLVHRAIFEDRFFRVVHMMTIQHVCRRQQLGVGGMKCWGKASRIRGLNPSDADLEGV